MQDILMRLQPIFREVLQDPNLTVGLASSGRNVPGWDSLAHVAVIAEVEQEFSVRFRLGELDALETVGDMVRLIDSKRSRP